MSRPSRIAALVALFSFVAPMALADPCTAVPDRGRLPAPLAKGKVFEGRVVYIGDGDSLCVSLARSGRGDPSQWVEVRLADFYAPELNAKGGREAKAALGRIVMGRPVSCQAQHRSYDRVVAVCRLGGRSVGDILRREARVREGGRGKGP